MLPNHCFSFNNLVEIQSSKIHRKGQVEFAERITGKILSLELLEGTFENDDHLLISKTVGTWDENIFEDYGHLGTYWTRQDPMTNLI